MRSMIFAGVLAVAALTGCASDRDNRTLAGAGIGAALGSVISGGNGAATVGGAVVGGVLGNQSANGRDDRRDYRRDTRSPYERCRDAGYSNYQCRRN